MPCGPLAYLVCIAVLFIKFCLLYDRPPVASNKACRNCRYSGAIYVKDIARPAGHEKTVIAVVSARVDTPQVIWLPEAHYPVPLACINRLNTQLVEAVLRTSSFTSNAMIPRQPVWDTAKILFFFNPFVKQLITAIRREREYSCD